MSTQEAAQRAGVGPTAIKRWADEGLLVCVRTAGGHRRFARRELEAFLRRHRETTDGAAADEVDVFLDTFLDAASAHEVAGLLLRERGHRGSWSAVADFIGGVLGRLGERWMEGSLTVFQEHVASERLNRAMTAIADALPVGSSSPRCLLACAGGDEHTLGLSLADLCVREQGFTSTWAGKGLPAPEVARAIREHDYDVVGVSASSYSQRPEELDGWLAEVSHACQARGTLLVLGGSGAWPSEAYGAQRIHRFVDFASILRDRRERYETRSGR